MTLDIDTSCRFRTGEEPLALVEAVRAADPLDEARWIEWKSDLDLDTREHQFKAAKAILGFANRTEEQSHGWADGFAYLLVGVEPGNLRGTQPRGTSVVEARLRKWVGSGDRSPRWAAGWISTNDCKVLVIEVGPPSPGDPLFPLRQEFKGFRNGTIFVRRQASSDPADSAEVLHLSDRAARSRRLSLSVEPTTPDHLFGVDLLPEVVSEILDIERESCLEPLAKALQRRQQKDQERREKALRNNPVLGDAMINVIGNMPTLDIGLGGFLGGPQRTEKGYEAEVNDHIASCAEVFHDVVVTKLISSSLAQVRISITNPTERHIPGVRVVATIDGPIYVDTTDRPDDLPERPVPYGKDSTLHQIESLSATGGWNLPQLQPAPSTEYAEEIQRDDGIEIRWPPTELPALETIELEPIDVAILTRPDHRSLTLSWRATSSGLDGVESGQIDLPVRSADPGINGVASLIWES